MRCLLCILTLSLPATQAAVVTWGGAGSSTSFAWWNDGNNSLATHWGQTSPPVLTGTDDAVINGGGIQKNGSLSISGGSDMTLNLGAAIRLNPSTTTFTVSNGSSLLINDGNFEAQVNAVTVSGSSSSIEVVSGAFVLNTTSTSAIGLNDGAQAIVRSGGIIETTTFFNSQNSNSTQVGGIFSIDGGTLLASGTQANPLRASQGLDGGGFDFTGLGGTIQIDDYSGTTAFGSYLGGKATTGFFMINGSTVSGFGQTNAVGGLWLELTDNTTSGSIVLVPELSTAMLAMLGTLSLLRRRR